MRVEARLVLPQQRRIVHARSSSCTPGLRGGHSAIPRDFSSFELLHHTGYEEDTLKPLQAFTWQWTPRKTGTYVVHVPDTPARLWERLMHCVPPRESNYSLIPLRVIRVTKEKEGPPSSHERPPSLLSVLQG